jgi:hypothetical protein
MCLTNLGGFQLTPFALMQTACCLMKTGREEEREWSTVWVAGGNAKGDVQILPSHTNSHVQLLLSEDIPTLVMGYGSVYAISPTRTFLGRQMSHKSRYTCTVYAGTVTCCVLAVGMWVT